MLKENCIKILGSGLSYIKTAYKNVILDIDQAEKEQKADSYTFSAEGFIPNSAEKYNLSLRSQNQVQSITPSELTHQNQKILVFLCQSDFKDSRNADKSPGSGKRYKFKTCRYRKSRKTHKKRR